MKVENNKEGGGGYFSRNLVSCYSEAAKESRVGFKFKIPKYRQYRQKMRQTIEKFL